MEVVKVNHVLLLGEDGVALLFTIPARASSTGLPCCITTIDCHHAEPLNAFLGLLDRILSVRVYKCHWRRLAQNALLPLLNRTHSVFLDDVRLVSSCLLYLLN